MPPKFFTLQIDAVSGLVVPCRGDAPLGRCRGVDNADAADYHVLVQTLTKLAADLTSSKKDTAAAGGGDTTAEDTRGKVPTVQFIDVGNNDPFLDLRVSALPGFSTVVRSWNPEAYNVAAIGACLNPNARVAAHRLQVATLAQEATSPWLAPPKNPKTTFVAGTALRLDVENFQLLLQGSLNVTLERGSPLVVYAAMGRPAQASQLGNYLLSHG